MCFDQHAEFQALSQLTDGQSPERSSKDADTTCVGVAGPWVIHSPHFPTSFSKLSWLLLWSPCDEKTESKKKKLLIWGWREYFLSQISCKAIVLRTLHATWEVDNTVAIIMTLNHVSGAVLPMRWHVTQVIVPMLYRRKPRQGREVPFRFGGLSLPTHVQSGTQTHVHTQICISILGHTQKRMYHTQTHMRALLQDCSYLQACTGHVHPRELHAYIYPCA